jgi:mxaC protein
MNLAVDHAWVLALLPLALLPLLLDQRPSLNYPAIDVIPVDRLSQGLTWWVRCSGAGLVVALVLALAGLHRPAREVEQLGQGAEIVLLLDRSSSMDRPFAGGSALLPALASPRGESKGAVARRLLSEFVAARRDDLYGMLIFSTRPIPVHSLTDRDDLVQAAIAVGGIGRGLARTDLGAGLLRALGLFDERPFTGSRIVLLVSDGAARLEPPVKERIAELARRNRVALYWIYIRSRNSPGLDSGLAVDKASEIAPEQLLHTFFQEIDTPYRAYSAEDPDAMARAIADVNRLQQLPIRYAGQIPRRDLAALCYAAALGLLLPVLGGRLLELQAWR